MTVEFNDTTTKELGAIDDPAMSTEPTAPVPEHSPTADPDDGPGRGAGPQTRAAHEALGRVLAEQREARAEFARITQELAGSLLAGGKSAAGGDAQLAASQRRGIVADAAVQAGRAALVKAQRADLFNKLNERRTRAAELYGKRQDAAAKLQQLIENEFAAAFLAFDSAQLAILREFGGTGAVLTAQGWIVNDGAHGSPTWGVGERVGLAIHTQLGEVWGGHKDLPPISHGYWLDRAASDERDRAIAYQDEKANQELAKFDAANDFTE